MMLAGAASCCAVTLARQSSNHFLSIHFDLLTPFDTALLEEGCNPFCTIRHETKRY